MKLCDVDDCDLPARRASAPWCEKHYMRWYRHGSPTTSVIADGFTISTGRRYRTCYRPGHPLADVAGKAYVHRIVLFDKIGDGVHECHWCHVALHWRAEDGEQLTADHLDADGANNAPENLVPACHACNSGRATGAKAAAARDHGYWIRERAVA